MQSLIKTIKKKKELQEISESFVKKELQTYLKQNPKLKKSLEKPNPKSANYKKIVKGVRARLRRVYSLFRSKERNDLIKELLNEDRKLLKKNKVIEEILKTHSSTKERLPFYNQLYQKIFKITKKPLTIIDLGSGINPFSIPYLKLRQLNYRAYDLNKEEIKNLNQYFEFLSKKNPFFIGKAEILDILQLDKLKKLNKSNELKKLKSADIAFLFKMTDVLDKGKGHKKTEEVIKKIPARFVIVSFPTKTMSGKRMNFPRRKWIELMCKRLNYKFKLLKFSNELFYVIEK